LLAEGVTVIIADKVESSLDEATGKLGPQVHAFYADLTRSVDAAALRKQVLEVGAPQLWSMQRV
jgi:hypothetical protein